jgi:DNA polymerase delta subunit 1
MVNFGVDTVAEAMKLGTEAAEKITKAFPTPIKLEFEKVYFPYLLMNKKRYAGLYWTNSTKWDKMDSKGIETVRRDICPLVTNVITDCLHMILIERNVNDAIEYVKRTIRDLLCNRIDLSLLVISKTLGKTEYSNKQVHVQLAARMNKRDPRSAPVVGDRVAYVITKCIKDAKTYEKAEDPIYVLEHDIPIDTEFYLKNQLMKPLLRIFEPIMGNPKQLFEGDHVRHIKLTSSSTVGIMKFTVKIRTCIGCKVPLSSTETVVCKHCNSNKSILYIKQMEKQRELEDLYSRTWSECQRCQGSLHQDVLCTSKDCPIFYRRKKVQKDLNEVQTILERFDF